MVNSHDARYILGEIRNIQYYEKRMAELKQQLREISTLIQEASVPRSPNGGKDVVVNGKTVRIKIPGKGYNSGSAVTSLITRQRPIEAEYGDFRKRWVNACRYRDELLYSDDTGFVEAFLSGTKTYRQLQDEFYVSNAYDRIIRLISQNVKKI